MVERCTKFYINIIKELEMDRPTYDLALETLCKIEVLVDSAIEQLQQIEQEEKESTSNS